MLTFGEGEHGKLGHDGEDRGYVPRTVDALVRKRVVQVAAGGGHAAVLTGEGEVLTFGYSDLPTLRKP